MISRWVKILGAALLTSAIWLSPAYAQRHRQEAPAQPGPRKPVIEYIVVVVLLAIPIGLVCRSSRRMV